MSNFFSLQLKPKRGFTLIELMIAISIIAILSSVGLVTYSSARMIARDSKRKQDLKAISQALELFYTEYKRYPCSGTNWTTSNAASWLSDSNAGSCGGSGVNISPNYISAMPKDPSGINNPSPWAQPGYGYLSTDTAFNAFTGCAKGTYYILITQLENPNDPERLGNKPGQVHPFCNTSLSQAAAYNLNSFVITVP